MNSKKDWFLSVVGFIISFFIIIVLLKWLKAEDVEFRIINMTGQIVYSEDLGEVNGSFNKGVNLGSINSGNYFIHLTVDGETQVEKFTVK